MEENPYQPPIGGLISQKPRRSRRVVNALIPIAIGLVPIVIALALFAVLYKFEMWRAPFAAP